MLRRAQRSRAISDLPLATAQADQAKARDALKLTEDEVEKGIEQAQAGLDAAKADLVLAQQEYTRYTNLTRSRPWPCSDPSR